MNSKHPSRPVHRPADSHEQPNGPEPAPLFGQEPRNGSDIPDDPRPASANGAGPVKPPNLPMIGAATPGPGADDWDLDGLRVSQDFGASFGVKRVITTVPVKKPDKTWFVRNHPDPAYRVEAMVLELREDRETYVIDARLHEALATEPAVTRQLLITSINRQGVLFLWPIRLPGLDGKSNPWNESAMEAARLAQESWVRVVANMALGANNVQAASAQLGEPAWPELSFPEVIKIAFRDRRISDWDHPALRRLRGEV